MDEENNFWWALFFLAANQPCLYSVQRLVTLANGEPLIGADLVR